MAKPQRVYQVWNGRNKFICNGRLVFGPDAKSIVVTLLLILVPVVIFCANVARNLLHEHNYRYFFLFVSSSALLCIFIFAMSALQLKFQIDYSGNLWKAIKESPASVILMAYCFFFLWFVGGLTCFHLYLIATNQTTNEKCGNSRKVDGVRLYDRGCLNNFREVFCTKIKPSRNNFRAYAQENETPEGEIDRREKVEDDQETGGNLLKITKGRDLEEAQDNCMVEGRNGTVPICFQC